MTFNSLQYAAFLPLVILLHWILPKRFRVALLLAASYVFYGTWDYRFLTLLLTSTVVDYWIARSIGRTENERRRRLLLLTSLAANLGILGFFKYFDFFIDSAASLLGRIGLEPNMPLLSIVLPVGISFYTFQTLSYTFDVYRRRMEPTNDLILFSAYVSYFPQLVAGPIERARRLLPQLAADRRPPTGDDIQSALGLILFGLFKKVVLADQMAPIVDRAFASPAEQSAVQIIAALVAFSIQIYGDFSGYSDIARGSSRLLSVELMVNFRQPYLSRSITEFWRRWHISLSSWLRDYLYVPLGGNRGNRLATYRNLMLTMVLGGLWHGAAWTFVIWGSFQGVMLSLHRAGGGKDSTEEPIAVRHLLPIFFTFCLISLSWVFFRGNSLEGSLALVEGLWTWRGPIVATIEVEQVFVWLLLMIGIDVAQRRAESAVTGGARSLRPVLGGALAGVGMTLIVLFSGSTSVPFIYFQF